MHKQQRSSTDPIPSSLPSSVLFLSLSLIAISFIFSNLLSYNHNFLFPSFFSSCCCSCRQENSLFDLSPARSSLCCCTQRVLVEQFRLCCEHRMTCTHTHMHTRSHSLPPETHSHIAQRDLSSRFPSHSALSDCSLSPTQPLFLFILLSLLLEGELDNAPNEEKGLRNGLIILSPIPLFSPISSLHAYFSLCIALHPVSRLRHSLPFVRRVLRVYTVYMHVRASDGFCVFAFPCTLLLFTSFPSLSSSVALSLTTSLSSGFPGNKGRSERTPTAPVSTMRV